MNRYFYRCPMCEASTEVADVWNARCAACGYPDPPAEDSIARSTVIALLTNLRQTYQAQDNPTAVEVLEVVLDRLTGWCRPGYTVPSLDGTVPDPEQWIFFDPTTP